MSLLYYSHLVKDAWIQYKEGSILNFMIANQCFLKNSATHLNLILDETMR